MFRQVGYAEFCRALTWAKNAMGPRGLCVTVPADDHPMQSYYLSDYDACGFMLAGNELCSVFANPESALPGALRHILAMADLVLVHDGFRTMKLDCFEGLTGLYGRHGFHETDRVEFNPEFAPEGWTDALGTPDVVFMRRPLDISIAA